MSIDRPDDELVLLLEDELEEAVELLPQQEPPEAMVRSEVRPDPSTPTDYGDPALIDPAD